MTPMRPFENKVACIIVGVQNMGASKPISHTSTRYMDFVEIFNIILDLSITCFSHFSGC